MGISKSSLVGLKIFSPASIQNNDLDFLETLKFETSDLRSQDQITKKDFLERFLNRAESVKPKKPLPAKSKLNDLLEEFCKKLEKTLMVKNDDFSLYDIKWERIDEFCNFLRRIERSDERKIRWVLYYLWRMGKTTITVKEIIQTLDDLQIKDVQKIIRKILKKETATGFVAEFDDSTLRINHDVNDKIVWHYLADEIEESFRRSPGEIEKEILELIDEGSFSVTEISDILEIDDATISRTLSKLRKNEKITLSSFGNRGSRYFTTNCDNCPFGTTKASCRKQSLSYIIDYFKNCFNVELSAPDFDEIQENQVLLKIKRTVSIAKKEKNTKMERIITNGFADLFGTAVDHSLSIKGAKIPEDVKLKTSDQLFHLPVLFHLGLFKGAETSYELINEILKTTKGISKSDRLRIKSLMENHSKKFLRFAGI